MLAGATVTVQELFHFFFVACNFVHLIVTFLAVMLHLCFLGVCSVYGYDPTVMAQWLWYFAVNDDVAG